MRFVGIVLIVALTLVGVVVGQSEDIEVVVYFDDNAPQLQSVSARSLTTHASVAKSMTDSIDIKNPHALRATNGVVGKVNARQLRELQNNPNVKVFQSPQMQLMLQDTIPLINASPTWAIESNGVNLTGAGQTVCVIDSGINYSHPDLGGCTEAEFLAGSCSSVVAGHDYWFNDNNPMDGNGHGTFVAGVIASQNSTYRGVAPDAKLVAIKACADAGSGCSAGAIVSGIDWCVANATALNISVISISIGTLNTYSETCDSVPDGAIFAPAIDAATAQNISVVIASGNGASTTGISSPACVHNATAISGSTKSDGFYNNGNRNMLVDLLAPGVSITSLDHDGTTRIDTGTSFSAPHASAAFAVMQQFLLSTFGSAASPRELTGYFNTTGVVLTDTGKSELNYTRIDLLGAVTQFDLQAPFVEFVAPTPQNYTIAPHTFVVNVTSSEELATAMLEWNATNYSMIEAAGSWYQSITAPNLDNISFRVFAIDRNDNINATPYRTVSFNNSLPLITGFFPERNVSINEPDNLTFFVNYTDFDDETATFAWFVNNTFVSNETNYTFQGNYSQASLDANTSYNISLLLSDPYDTTYHQWNLTVLNTNRPPIFNEIPANVTINENTQYSVVLNASDPDGDVLFYTLNNSQNASINGTNVSLIVLPNFTGLIWLTATVSDGKDFVNTSWVINVTLTRFDFDGDGISDDVDPDDDNDGVNDEFDSITGNASTLNTSYSEPLLLVNGSSNTSKRYEGVQTVSIVNGSTTILSFPWNFSQAPFVANFTLLADDNTSDVSYLLIHDLSLNTTKNITFVPKSMAYEAVCIIDEDLVSVTDFSEDCNAASEILLVCPGASGSYTCDTQNESYYISGLQNSAIIQSCTDADDDGFGIGCSAGPDCDDADATKAASCVSATTSSSGGGGGGGGGGGSASNTPTNPNSRVFGNIRTSQDLLFKPSGIPLIEIQLTPAEAVSQGTIEVLQQASDFYTGIEVITDFEVQESIVRIAVNQSYYAERNISTSRILFNGIALDTEISTAPIILQAIAPGVGTFDVAADDSVIAEPGVQEEQNNTITEPQVATSAPSLAEPTGSVVAELSDPDLENSRTPLIAGIMIALSAILVGGGIFIRSRQKSL